MSFPRYPEYKDSGVEWLGEVPGHWMVAPLKRGFAVTLGKMLQPDSSGPDDELLPYLRAANIQWTGVDVSDIKQMWLSPRDREQLALQFGDLLVSEGGDVGRSCLWGDEVANCSFQNSVNRVRAIQGGSTRFLYYWMSTIKDKGYVDVLCNKSTIAHFTAEKVAAVPVPFPPPPEQIGIATFLDRETAKIDALVAEQEKLITLLQEKRQAVISHAVTKGLDPNVPMKDSGVEWLGEVPAHWEVLPLKRISPQQTVGIVVNPSEYLSDEGLPFIYGGNVTEGRIDHISSRRISPEDSQRNEKTRLKAGDLITVRVGAPGITAVVPPECEGGNCASVMLVRQGEFNSDWLCFVMNSRVVRYQVEIVQYGAAQQQFNINHAVEFVIPQPPRAEQDALASFLTSETTRLGNLEAEARTAIALLQERRTALISAAVTGQIDVRGLAGSANAPDSVAASAYPASA